MEPFELSVTGVRDIWQSIDTMYVEYVEKEKNMEKFHAFLVLYHDRLVERHPDINMMNFKMYLDDPFVFAMKNGDYNLKNEWIHAYRNVSTIRYKLPGILYILFITYERLLSDYGFIIL